MAYTYILRLANNSYYVGCCHNLKNRLEQHLKGYVTSTCHKRPLVLLYARRFNSYRLANAEEYRIKRWKKRKSIENLILYDRNNLFHGPDIGTSRIADPRLRFD